MDLNGNFQSGKGGFVLKKKEVPVEEEKKVSNGNASVLEASSGLITHTFVLRQDGRYEVTIKNALY